MTASANAPSSTQAIRAAAGEYLVFFGSNCVAPAHCLAVHTPRAPRQHHYLSGGRCL
jgi:hypothetical protein